MPGIIISAHGNNERPKHVTKKPKIERPNIDIYSLYKIYIDTIMRTTIKKRKYKRPCRKTSKK